MTRHKDRQKLFGRIRQHYHHGEQPFARVDRQLDDLQQALDAMKKATPLPLRQSSVDLDAIVAELKATAPPFNWVVGDQQRQLAIGHLGPMTVTVQHREGIWYGAARLSDMNVAVKEDPSPIELMRKLAPVVSEYMQSLTWYVTRSFARYLEQDKGLSLEDQIWNDNVTAEIAEVDPAKLF
jgi:hypothetical protein